MKTLDIEKIKAALSYHAYVPPTASSRPQKYHERLAVEALAALEAYDPDAIRRECAEKLYDAFFRDTGPHGYEGAKADQDALMEYEHLKAAIMNAGKE